jgi:hypothetical protein
MDLYSFNGQKTPDKGIFKCAGKQMISYAELVQLDGLGMNDAIAPQCVYWLI